MASLRINRFWSVVATLLLVYGFVKWGIPAASREITSLPFPLPVPGTLVFIYMALTVVALFIFVTFSDTYMQEFLQPIKKFLTGGYGTIPRTVGLVAIPLLVGWQVYAITRDRRPKRQHGNRQGGIAGEKSVRGACALRHELSRLPWRQRQR